ncbi:uncharacterized protein Dwil_GK25586 [Drosophila willistoni]|uniref:Protein swallow n=1 Tax=Drosophila willistoni TaxID=7260 RepID=B4NE66_DROWI|nr:protein swallow [Drosophila willistoni]EDW82035.2 uncharacterized protein Dwil_GK25586 [Drosophila willistoni]
MSLDDESFPADELFDQLSPHVPKRHFQQDFKEHHQPEAFERNAPPFFFNDCSEENSFDEPNKSAKTCVSDPVGLDQDDDQYDDEGNPTNIDNGKTNPQLGNGHSSKSKSFQDIHSVYTKRRYAHVTSKVAKYISDIDKQDQQRRSSSNKIQHHSSMPETLTPTNSNPVRDSLRIVNLSNFLDDGDEMHKSNESLATGSAMKIHDVIEFERLVNENEEMLNEKAQLQNEKERLQSYCNYLQDRFDKKAMETMMLRKNFDIIRNELTNSKDKLKRQQIHGHSMVSLVHHPLSGIERSTQTERNLEIASSSSSRISNLSDLPVVTPHPNLHLNNLTYDSSVGSIEIALLSVAPANPNPRKMNIQPLSLNFSNDSVEVNNNAAHGSSSRPGSSNRTESSQPSSNDSAIDIDRSPFYGGNCEGTYFFDKGNNRVVKLANLLPLNPSGKNNKRATTTNNSDRNTNLLDQSLISTQGVPLMRSKPSLGTRLLRLFGPCTRCHDPHNQSANASSVTYTVSLPLLDDETYNRSRNRNM